MHSEELFARGYKYHACLQADSLFGKLHATFHRHLFTSAEDLVQWFRGYDAKVKSRQAPPTGVKTPDRDGQRRERTRHSPNVSPATGSPGRPGKGRPRSLFLSGFLRN